MSRKLASRPQWQIAMTFTVAGRVACSVIAAALSFVLHPNAALIRSNALTETLPQSGTIHYALLGIWERFDTLWYLHIAQYGYDQPMAAIFYPLYPATIRALNWAMSPMLAALLISTVAAFFAFWGLLRMAESEKSPSAGVSTLFVLIAWPSSFVLFAGYAESLLLALIVWVVIFAREHRWELATFLGLLAGLGRPSGVLVAIPLLLLAWRSRQVRSIVVFLSPFGLLGYWSWLRWTGRISVVEAYRIYQRATFAPPWASLSEIVRLVVHGDTLLAVKFALVVIALGFSLRREVRIEDKLFAIALTAQMLMYTGRPLLGGPRYVLPMYPAFLAIGEYAAQHWTNGKFSFYLGWFGFLNLVWMWAFLDWSLVF